MARKPRYETEPGIAHLWFRGNNRVVIFLDDEDRFDYLLRLRLIAEELGWRVLAFCLMGNHVHLLIETTEPNLGIGMRILQGGYAQQFNRKYGRTGHLFEDRFGWVPILDDDHLKVAARYIARNPVEAGLAGAPGEWGWDSFPAPGRQIPRFVDGKRLLEWFGEQPDQALEAYREFVSNPLPEVVA